MTITLKRTVNLSEPILPEVLSAPLYEGEKNAHTFMITAEKDKLPHALSGAVVAYFERNDGNTVRVEGETKDGAAILTLSPECYQTGVFYLAVMLISDGAQTVIYAASGRVRNTQDGEIINGGDAIPSYDEIMAHLSMYLNANVTAKVVPIPDGAEIIMSDAVNGETVAFIKNGTVGPQGDPGDDNVFVVKLVIDENGNFAADKSQIEVRTAVAEGKAVIALDAELGTTFLYMGEGVEGGETCPVFVAPLYDHGSEMLLKDILYLKKTGEVVWRSGSPINPLIIHYGDQEYYFSGSELVSLNIKDDVFVIRVDKNGKANQTQTETIAAKDAGKAVLLVMGNGEVLTYAFMNVHPNYPSDLSPVFVSSIYGDFGETKYRSLAYLLSDKTVVTRTESINTSGGSGGGGSGLPATTDPHQMLVTDSDGNTVWNDRTHYAYEELVDVVPETTYIAADVTNNGIMIKTRAVLENGKTYTVLYNGREYPCTALVTPAKPILAALGVTVDDSVMGGILGNLGFIDPSMATSEPFVLMVFQGVDLGNGTGEYGYILPLDNETSGSFAIRGMVKKYKTIDPEYLPKDASVKQITIERDGAYSAGRITCDTPFAEAWEMSDNELLSAIVVRSRKDDVNMSASAVRVAHVVFLGINELMILVDDVWDGLEGEHHQTQILWGSTPGGEVFTAAPIYTADYRYLAPLIPKDDSLTVVVDGSKRLGVATMSETTKGGAKVGKGLKMDGDVLSAVEPEAVLIETITVEEEVAEIKRSREPDGTQYGFSSVAIRAKFPPSEKTGNLSIDFTFGWPAELRSYILSPYNATQKRTGYSKCYLSNRRWRCGWWTCAYGPGDYAQYYENPVQQEIYGEGDGYISSIKLYHVSGIEIGTIFEIWGVRA